MFQNGAPTCCGGTRKISYGGSAAVYYSSVVASTEDIARDIVRIREANKTSRVRWIVGGIVVCVGMIVYAAVTITDNPPWLVVTLAVVAVLPQVFVVKVTIGIFRSYVKRKNERVRDLERISDPSRTTSGLEPDGAASDDS